MQIKLIGHIALIVTTAGALFACSQQANQDAQAACDRGCLEGYIDRYLNALADHDPSTLPMSDDVLFVENNQLLTIGKGTWSTVTGLGTYRHYFADPATGQVAVISVVEENGMDIIYDLRLKIENQQIVEIEALAVRDPSGAARYEELGEPLSIFLEPVPEAQRSSREELIEVADKYFSGMENNDPDGDYSFFADDCDRLEHATKTTNNEAEEYGHSDDTVFVTLSCREQFETGFLGFVTRIRDRRYAVIDEERQSIFAFASLDHDGTVREIPLSTGTSFIVPPYFSTSRTLQVGEAWRVENNRLRQIEMTLSEFPYGTRPVWTTNDGWLDQTIANPEAPDNTRCDRVCLVELVDRFLTAVIARDPGDLPMVANVKYTQNGQRLAIGDGLWGTMTETGDYKQYLANSERGVVGYYGAITEHDVPGVIAVRLRIDERRISEIEVVVVREEYSSERGGTLTLFAPRLPYLFEPESFAAPESALSTVVPASERSSPTVLASTAARYYDGLAGVVGSAVPFDPDCEQRVNGVSLWPCAEQLNSNFFGSIDQVRDRRTLVADSETGLVMDLALFDIRNEVDAPTNADGIATPASSTGPFSVMATQLYKIESGKISKMEAVLKPVPLGMRSGWN